ncbi:hypothetical protein [Nocardioides sp. 616]|uniref:hypothetical protein n=1 Tax=Nocardioides sp. 616 TaxID=2268090 RepID=UPI000CE4CF8B|nr:hypothetical protein [Nocardioides sp. 616]
MGVRGVVAASALVATLLSGCGDDAGAGAVAEDAAWRTSTDPVEVRGLAWAAGSTVHLADGTEIHTADPVRAFLVAGDGVFYEPLAQDEEDGSSFAGGPLYFAAPGREPVDTGLSAYDREIAASPDGTTLVLLDTDHDEGRAVLRFFDLATGEAFTSEDGMENDHDDPEWNLSEAEVHVRGVSDDAVYVSALEGNYVYDLATGEGRPAGEDDEPPGWDAGPSQSPDGRWRIEQRDTGPDRVVDRDGEEVDLVLEEPRSALSWWADEETVVGTVARGPGRGNRTRPGDAVSLLSCVMPSGECTTYPESTGQLVLFPAGSEIQGIYLQGGDE